MHLAKKDGPSGEKGDRTWLGHVELNLAFKDCSRCVTCTAARSAVCGRGAARSDGELFSTTEHCERSKVRRCQSSGGCGRLTAGSGVGEIGPIRRDRATVQQNEAHDQVGWEDWRNVGQWPRTVARNMEPVAAPARH